MKVNFDRPLGSSRTYSQGEEAPDFVTRLLALGGVKSVFVCADFVTLNKETRADWKVILKECAALFESSAVDSNSADTGLNPPTAPEKVVAIKQTPVGENQVLVQTFKGIPLQIKVVDAAGEARLSLGEIYNQAAQQIQKSGSFDYLKERYWADHGVRYGDRDIVAAEVLSELQGIFGIAEINAALADFLSAAGADSVDIDAPIASATASGDLKDWQMRLKDIHTLSQSGGDTAVFVNALKDENAQVRRLAAAALGASADRTAVKPLCETLLNDSSIAVRRTAGDALSDLGDSAVESAMCQALADPSKLVRWRAARFLNENGSITALSYLKAASDDSEFEVKLEVEAAIERIEAGGETVLPAWKRIAGLEN